MAAPKGKTKPAKKKPASKKKWRKGHHPGGRPTAYKIEYSDMAKLCIEDSGFSMYKLAKLFDVSRSTIYKWIEDHKEFSDSVEKARDKYDGIKIHKSLVKRAEGFAYIETTQEAKPVIFKHADGAEEIQGDRLLVTKKVRKYFPPDIASIKHWQVNRDPGKWKDKHDVDLTDSRMVQDILAALPPEIAEGVKAAIKAKGKK